MGYRSETLEPIVVNKGKKLHVRDFNKAEIEQIVKELYFSNFGINKPLAKVGDEFVSIEQAIAYLQELNEEEIIDGTKSYVDIANFIPGVTARLRAVAKNHYDLANGQGKAGTVILCETILNEYTYLGLPANGDDNLVNDGGYPTAQGLHEQLNAVYEKLPNVIKEAIKLVEIPCYIPKYDIGDAKYISKLFVPSATELGYSHETDQYVPENGDGTKYAYFEEGNGNDAIEKRLTKFVNGNSGYYWTRTPSLSDALGWYCVDNDGYVSSDTTDVCCGLALAFCI